MRIRSVISGLAVAGLAAVLPAAGASASASHAAPSPLATHHMTITRNGVTAHVTVRGNWKLSSVRLPGTRLPAPRITRRPSAVPNSYGTAHSTNWSGYVDVAKSGQTFRFITANFNIPSINCAASTPGTSGDSYYSAWTGLDGWNGTTVEQQGIETECATGGATNLWTFYEMYPANPVAFTGANPGDALQSSTYYSATTHRYSLVVTDETQGGAGISVQVACASTCKRTSAEAISEAPGNGPPLYGLSDFGGQNFTTGQATTLKGAKGYLASTSLWNSYNVNLEDTGSHIMAQPGALQGGEAFLDLWKAST